MESAFDLVKQIEAVRNIVVFSQTQNGKIDEILNLQELSNKWQYFIKKEANSIPFYNELKARSPETIEDFIINGNKEFSNSEELSSVLCKNLFYYILLNANFELYQENRVISQSQIFPNINLNVNIDKTIVSIDENISNYRLVGLWDKNSVNEADFIKLYQEIYQPIIKYSYTEFNLIYRINYTLDTKTGLLLAANASIKEAVKNNYETVTKFELRKIEL